MPARLAPRVLVEPGAVDRPERGDRARELGGGHRAGHLDQDLLLDAIRDAGDLADLGVGEPPCTELGDGERQRGQRAGDAEVLPRGAGGHRAGPAEPVRGRLQPLVEPHSLARVELREHQQELARGLGDHRGLVLDPSAEPLGVLAVEPRGRSGAGRRRVDVGAGRWWGDEGHDVLRPSDGSAVLQSSRERPGVDPHLRRCGSMPAVEERSRRREFARRRRRRTARRPRRTADGFALHEERSRGRARDEVRDGEEGARDDKGRRGGEHPLAIVSNANYYRSS